MAEVSKDDVIRALSAQLEAKKYAKLKSFKPYPKQLEFMNSTADYSELVLRAGSQVGKSECGAFMTAVFLTGMYPSWWKGRRFPGAVRAWTAGESSVAVRDINQLKLCGGSPNDADAWGTGMIPKDALVSYALGHGATGGLDTLRVRHVSGGISTLGFKSYEMSREKWQGSTLDFIWCDEEPPLDLFLEGIARLTATRGLMFSTFTPLKGSTEVLARYSERSEIALRTRLLVPMSMKDAGHLSDPKRQEELLAAYPQWQRRARIDGLPLLGTGSVWEGVQLDDILTPITYRDGDVWHPDLGPVNAFTWRFLWGIDLGISHPFAAVLLAHDTEHDTVYVLAEVKMRDAIPREQAQRMLAIAPNVKVAWPHDAAQRERGSGEQIAKLYKQAGLQMLPTHASFSDGSISTEAGIAVMLDRMRSNRFKVSDRLIEWQSEFSTYHRDNGLLVKINDDLMSATRVGIMALRHAHMRNAFPGWRAQAQRDRQAQAAREHEGDPFYSPGAYD